LVSKTPNFPISRRPAVLGCQTAISAPAGALGADRIAPAVMVMASGAGFKIRNWAILGLAACSGSQFTRAVRSTRRRRFRASGHKPLICHYWYCVPVPERVFCVKGRLAIFCAHGSREKPGRAFSGSLDLAEEIDFGTWLSRSLCCEVVRAVLSRAAAPYPSLRESVCRYRQSVSP